ncbi:MAG: type II CAAX prenyl endopeptidase Rce1 family protein [Bacteroidota bacterium]
MDHRVSNRIFILLIVTLSVAAAAGVFLPQNTSSVPMPTAELPASRPVLALANAGIVLVVYGALGWIGLLLSRRLGLPEIWDAAVTNRQRFLIPLLAGFGAGALIILGDAAFSPINGIGHFPHPPFPTSIVASLAAGIGEEVLFRLFFISFWTWLVSRVLLRGRWQMQVFWFFGVLSAIAFGLSHLPSVMFLMGWTSLSQVPAMLIIELILLNGVMSIFAAYYFRKYGFLAPVGIHFWADILWHVIWGLV